jgi:hypothetical protein
MDHHNAHSLQNVVYSTSAFPTTYVCPYVVQSITYEYLDKSKSFLRKVCSMRNSSTLLVRSGMLVSRVLWHGLVICDTHLREQS